MKNILLVLIIGCLSLSTAQAEKVSWSNYDTENTSWSSFEDNIEDWLTKEDPKVEEDSFSYFKEEKKENSEKEFQNSQED